MFSLFSFENGISREGYNNISSASKCIVLGIRAEIGFINQVNIRISSGPSDWDS